MNKVLYFERKENRNEKCCVINRNNKYGNI